MDIYKELVDAGCKVESRYSDLHVKITPESKKIIEKHPALVKTVFRNQVDGKLWYEIFGAYTPYWKRKLKK